MLITSPAEHIEKHRTTLFIAGGISNCWDWQTPTIKRLLDSTDLVLFNPRRTNWNMENSDAESKKQILWEHRHLAQADYIMFWFPSETLCPITLFELGKYLKSEAKLIVGTHPDYQRRLDVIVQTEIERPELIIYDDLDKMVSDFIADYNGV